MKYQILSGPTLRHGGTLSDAICSRESVASSGVSGRLVALYGWLCTRICQHPSRHRAQLALCVVTVCSVRLCLAGGDRIDNHTFVAYSPSNMCYGVQTLTQWVNGLEGRFQVFRTQDGSLVWAVDKLFGSVGEVLLADDGEHMATVATEVTSFGYEEGQELSNRQSEELRGVVAISFYRRGKLLKQHTLGSLEFDLTDLLHTARGVVAFTYADGRYEHHWHWDRDAGVDWIGLGHEIKGQFLTLARLDSTVSIFDMTSGEEVNRLRVAPTDELMIRLCGRPVLEVRKDPAK